MASPYETAIDPQTLRGKHLHFMGIGGSGITTVAQMALLEGAICSGCEQSLSHTTEWIAGKGVRVVAGHDPAHLDGVDMLVISPAITKLNPDNPEVAVARERGIPVYEWQALLGAFMAGKLGCSIAGVHGKGTTTAMFSQILIAAGLDPTCEVGAIVPAWGGNVRMGQGRYFTNEADEFNHNFLHYHPRLAVITSIEFEHPEFFKDYAAMCHAFDLFVAGMDMQGQWDVPPALVLNWDSPGCRELRGRLGDWPGVIVTYSLDGPADYVGTDLRLEGETSFAVHDAKGGDLGRFTIQLPGRFNVENALATIAAARQLGIAPDVIRAALANFTGTYRRFQVSQAGNDIVIVDDYAHHPTAIDVTLEAMRQRFPNRRLIAVFQPNIFTRLKTLLEEFSHCFGEADEVVIVDIHPGREVDTGLVHARDLVAGIQRDQHFVDRPDRVYYGGSIEQTQALLEQLTQPGDMLAMLGSGPIYHIAAAMLESHAFAGYKPGARTEY
jgi:UDP-N-acetylmuramate--alanine ligase